MAEAPQNPQSIAQELGVAAPPGLHHSPRQETVRDHKLAFGTSVSLAILLIIGFAISTRSFFGEKAARERAIAEKKEAETRAQRAKASELEATRQRDIALEAAARERLANQSAQNAAKFLNDLFFAIGNYNARDPTLNPDFLFRAAEDRLPSIGTDARASALVLSSFGQVAFNWRRYDQATNWLGRSVALWRALADHSQVEAQKKTDQRELAAALNLLAWATLREVGRQDGLGERARKAEPLAREAFEVQKAATHDTEDTTLCFQADWLRMHQLAGATDNLDSFMAYLATIAGQPKTQFEQIVRTTILRAGQSAGAGNTKEAQQRIRQFIQPLLDPSRPRFGSRLPLSVAYAGDQIRKSAPSLSIFLGGDIHELELCGASFIAVAAQLGAELLPAGHPDLNQIAALAEQQKK